MRFFKWLALMTTVLSVGGVGILLLDRFLIGGLIYVGVLAVGYLVYCNE